MLVRESTSTTSTAKKLGQKSMPTRKAKGVVFPVHIYQVLICMKSHSIKSYNCSLLTRN